MDVVFAAMDAVHLSGVVALQRACFPPPFPESWLWAEAHLMEHLDRYPEGQWVALESGLVVGSCSTLIISEANWLAHADWSTTVGGPTLANHDPQGSTLYGVDISIHPNFRRRGLGRKFYDIRYELVQQRHLLRLGTACRIPDWHTWSRQNPGQSKSAYCQTVVRGEAKDRTLTPLLRYGLRWLDVIENYMEDEESGDAAALLAKENLQLTGVE